MRLRPSTTTLGIRGESLAREALEARGYAILDTRYRSRFGEIDIVCDHAGVVVFVEVRARRSRRYGTAAESISRRKQRRVAAMALDYLARNGRLERRCRFDVVAIDGLDTPAMTISIIPDAFPGAAR